MENFLAPTHSAAAPSPAGVDIRTANAFFCTREVIDEINPTTNDEKIPATVKKNNAFAFIILLKIDDDLRVERTVTFIGNQF